MQVPVYGAPAYSYPTGWGFPNPQQAAWPAQQHSLPPLPQGWELLYDQNGRVYYGCPARQHVQWKFPLDNSQPTVSTAQSQSHVSQPHVPAPAFAHVPPPAQTSVPAQPDIQEVDAQDSQGYWYQAFIVKQDEEEALVHFSGWGKATAEKIKLTDFPKRIRARSATTATGQGVLPSKEEVRKMFGVPAAAAAAAELPSGWETFQDSSGRVYYGNKELKTVQWEHPSLGVSSGKRELAAKYVAQPLLPRCNV